MKIVAITFKAATCCLLFGSFAIAADDESAEIVSMSIGQIHADQSQLEDHRYISTGQPNSETLALVADAGFTTVIDLRTDGEDRGIDEASEVAALGMTYVSIPVGGPGDLSLENAKKLDRAIASANGPVLLHCASGNRVGALVALRAKGNGASSEDALAIGRKAGLTRSEQAVKSKLDEH